MKKLNYITVFFMLIAGGMFAQQDVHFSQFFSSPLTVNPAQAGIFSGDIRVIANYRSQWGSIDVPYKTMAASVDLPVFNSIKNGMFGLGVNFVKDDAGDSKFATTNPNLALAYHLDVSGGLGKQYLSVGFQGGMIQRSINGADLTWDEQWDGRTFNTSLNSYENAGTSTVEVIDFATGIHWYYAPKDHSNYHAGVSMGHITSPDVSFSGTSDPLLKKYTIHGGAEIGSDNSNTAVLPNFIYTMQGANRYFNMGAEMKYRLQETSKFTNFHNEMSVTLGGYLRFGDAVYAVSRFNWANLSFGVSYDFNLSDLSAASNGMGGVELMLGYRAAFNSNPTRTHSVRFQ